MSVAWLSRSEFTEWMGNTWTFSKLLIPLLFGGVFVVVIGYAQVAHTIDPCANGWWGPGSMIGSQPLCERFGSEWNWHTRFHLAAHALPAIPLVALYAWSVRHNLRRDPNPI